MLIPALTQLRRGFYYSLCCIWREEKMVQVIMNTFNYTSRVSLSEVSSDSSCSVCDCNLPFSLESPEVLMLRVVNQHVKTEATECQLFIVPQENKSYHATMLAAVHDIVAQDSVLTAAAFAKKRQMKTNEVGVFLQKKK